MKNIDKIWNVKYDEKKWILKIFIQNIYKYNLKI